MQETQFLCVRETERERAIRSARNRERGNTAVVKYRLTLSDVEIGEQKNLYL
jgi:hypothetical protein